MRIEENEAWVSGGDAAQQVRGRAVTLWTDAVAMNDAFTGTPGFVALTAERARRIQDCARAAMVDFFGMSAEDVEKRPFVALYPFMTSERELCGRSRGAVLWFAQHSGERMGEVVQSIHRAIMGDGIHAAEPVEKKKRK